MISIIDYGMGNLKSVEKALEFAILNKKLDQKIIITNDKKQIENSDAIILPGVGAFGIAMKHLKELDLINILRQQIMINKKFFLGICLGYQLLFDKSYEEGEFEGLGILKGEVKKFDKDMGIKIPHMGWNTVEQLKIKSYASNKNEVQYFYFVHSYYVDIAEKNLTTFWTKYGIKFLSGIQKENIFGVQFHPEKSQSNGIKFLENWCSKITVLSKTV